jgi:membrane-associated phospholipid phosphatase
VPPDPFLELRIVEGRSTGLVAAARAVSTVGQPAVMIGLLVVVVGVLARRARSWAPVVVGAGVVALLGLLDNLVKTVVARPRPPAVWQAATAHGWSFPSGHALWSAGVLTAVVLLARAGPWRRLLVVVAFVVVVAVGGSRLVLAVHYPSDVLAGWCLALVATGIPFLTATALIGRARNRATEMSVPP